MWCPCFYLFIFILDMHFYHYLPCVWMVGTSTVSMAKLLPSTVKPCMLSNKGFCSVLLKEYNSSWCHHLIHPHFEGILILWVLKYDFILILMYFSLPFTFFFNTPHFILHLIPPYFNTFNKLSLPTSQIWSIDSNKELVKKY